MSNEVASLEAEIREYKLQVSALIFPHVSSDTNPYHLDSSTLFNQAYKPIQTMQICKDSKQSLKKSFPSPQAQSQS